MASNFLDFAIERLGEPSTYAALSMGLMVVGQSLPSGVLQDITFVGMTFSVVAGVLIKEGWKQSLETGDLVKALEARIATLEANVATVKKD